MEFSYEVEVADAWTSVVITEQAMRDMPTARHHARVMLANKLSDGLEQRGYPLWQGIVFLEEYTIEDISSPGHRYHQIYLNHENYHTYNPRDFMIIAKGRAAKG